MKSFFIQLEQVQPSQLYISQAKLTPIIHNYKSGKNQVLPPVPIKELDGRLIYTDGHTRALAAFINGQETITAVWDEDELDWEAYQICVDWCLEEDIQTIADQGYLVLMAYYFAEVAGHVAFVGHSQLDLFTIPPITNLEGKNGQNLDSAWLPVMVQAGTYTGITSMVYATNKWLVNDNFRTGVVRYYALRLQVRQTLLHTG